MQYLKIKNKGLLNIDNLIDIASSTKRYAFIVDEKNLIKLAESNLLPNDTLDVLKDNLLNHAFLNEKDFKVKLDNYINNADAVLTYFRNRSIGKFGTGLKQAYCYFLRENISFRVFSGLDEFKIFKSTKISDGIYSDFVTINGIVTNLNIAFGIDDYNLQMVISEIWTNAIDETEEVLAVVDEKDVFPEMDSTCIYIAFNSNLKAFYNNWNEYFAFNRIDCIYNDIDSNENGIKIYANSNGDLFNSLIIYRRGIQVYTYPMPSIYHYNIDTLEITGSRIVKNTWDLNQQIYKILCTNVNSQVVTDLLKGLNKSVNCYEATLSWGFYSERYFSDNWKIALKNSKIVENDKKDFYKESIFNCDSTLYSLPSSLTNNLIKLNDIEHVNGSLSSINNGGIEILDLSDEQIKFLNNLEDIVDTIPDKVFNAIKLYTPTKNGEIVAIINDILYVSKDYLNYRSPILNLLTDILIENELYAKYKSKRDYSISVLKEICNKFITHINKLDWLEYLNTIRHGYINVVDNYVLLYVKFGDGYKFFSVFIDSFYRFTELNYTITEIDALTFQENTGKTSYVTEKTYEIIEKDYCYYGDMDNELPF